MGNGGHERSGPGVGTGGVERWLVGVEAVLMGVFVLVRGVAGLGDVRLITRYDVIEAGRIECCFGDYRYGHGWGKKEEQ